DGLPHWSLPYVDLESAAVMIRSYEAQFVPGLLQTEEYMRAVIQGALLDDTPDVAEQRVQLRLTRQTLLDREGAPRLWAVVDEAALRRPVGSREVMRTQLERLIEAAELPNVTPQGLAVAAGAPP